MYWILTFWLLAATCCRLLWETSARYRCVGPLHLRCQSGVPCAQGVWAVDAGFGCACWIFLRSAVCLSYRRWIHPDQVPPRDTTQTTGRASVNPASAASEIAWLRPGSGAPFFASPESSRRKQAKLSDRINIAKYTCKSIRARTRKQN